MSGAFFTTFCLLAATTLALALGRLLIVRFKGDECLHLLDSEVPLIQKQKTASRRLEIVDVWGRILTILTMVSAIAAYGAWWISR